MKNGWRPFVLCTLLLTVVIAAGKAVEMFQGHEDSALSGVIDIAPELVPLTEKAPVNSMLMPIASGINVQTSPKVEIDYSNAKDGYIMVHYKETNKKPAKLLVKGPGGETYTYSLKPTGRYEAFPLSDGNGEYKIGAYENISDNRYFTVSSISIQVKLDDELAPFLHPNIYVNYDMNSNVVRKAAELTQGDNDLLKKIAAVYKYVTENIVYDEELAATVQSGYLPDLDAILAKGKGICFDYAAVTTAMLRSQMIPTKLVVGYTGNVYHAWINVYSEQTGWINSAIYFDGVSWKLMDPTFSANEKSLVTVAKYIGNPNNYIAKYLY